MNTEASPRQQLIQAISNLSDRQVILMLEWVESLKNEPVFPLNDSTVDPLAEFIGSNTHGDLASTIDETLYG